MNIIVALVLVLKLIYPVQVLAQTNVNSDQYGIARVEEVKKIEVDEIDKQIGQNFAQEIKLKFLTGEDKNKDVVVNNSTTSTEELYKFGQIVIVKKSVFDGLETYDLQGKYRIRLIELLTLLFVALVLILTKFKGLGSLFGFVSTLGVLLYFVVPNIFAGLDPLIVSFLGCLAIATVSMFLSHGFNRKTVVAYLSTILLLVLSVGLSSWVVKVADLSGAGSEESLLLLESLPKGVNLQGLLLAGIIIGIMGVLDDITTAQVAAVEEIYNANPKLSRRELYVRGTSVGREHIASLVNTLMLAYAGTSLPLFLLINLNVNKQPLWVILSSSMIAEEIVRTMVGSIVLVLAVPITTIFAALWLKKKDR